MLCALSILDFVLEAILLSLDLTANCLEVKVGSLKDVLGRLSLLMNGAVAATAGVVIGLSV